MLNSGAEGLPGESSSPALEWGRAVSPGALAVLLLVAMPGASGKSSGNSISSGEGGKKLDHAGSAGFSSVIGGPPVQIGQ